MATDVILPRVDMDMATGRVSHWYVKAGERVEKGAALFEIETDKAAMEIEAPASGRLQIVVQSGSQVPVGSTVGWILADGESEVSSAPAAEVPAEAPAQKPAEPVAEPKADALVVAASPAPVSAPSPAVSDPAQSTVPASYSATTTSVPASTAREIRATPLSRRLAAEHGVDLAAITGTGPKGRIQSADVTAFAAETSAKPATSIGFLNGTWLRQGAGEPIVMIHGFGSDIGGWRPFIQGLPANLPIYAIDLPGHGGSALSGIFGIDDIVAQVIASLRGAGIAGGHLVGHSLGGAVAALVMASGQFATKSLFLIAPGGLGPEANTAFLNGFAAAASESALDTWMHELVEDPDAMTPALVKATAKLRAGTALPQTQGKIADLLFAGGVQGFSTLAALKAPTVPTRVVFGKADRIIPVGHAARLSGHVAVHLFAGVGHLPHYEVRDAVAALLLQHIRSAG